MSAKKNKIDQYLPPQEELVLLQARVPVRYRDQVKAIIDERGYTWNELITRLLEMVIRDHGG